MENTIKDTSSRTTRATKLVTSKLLKFLPFPPAPLKEKRIGIV
jgi:hypothetical protein